VLDADGSLGVICVGGVSVELWGALLEMRIGVGRDR
jgi:hypothetical protein